MERFIYACLIPALISAAALDSVQVVEDPCGPAWYTVLGQTHRSTGYDTRPSDSPFCDNQLKRGWYRFTGLNGTDTEIATTCPGTDTCGTVIPLWMNGSHPDTKGGIVVRRLCGRKNRDDVNGSCCDVQDELFVKNCSSFYIYYLNPTITCPSGYCAGTARRCPVDKWSSTNFEPCRDLAPVLDTPPIVHGPNVANQTFDFRCEIVFAPNDTDQVFDVLWTFNDMPDPAIKPEMLTGDHKVATLSGDKLKAHLDTNVSCQVSTYYEHRDKKNVYKSNVNFFGVQGLKLTGPNIRGTKSFDFECEVTFGSNDTNQQIEVIWIFDDKQDPEIKPQIISGKERKVTLDGRALKGHFNSSVGCQARLVYEESDIKTAFRKSNTYFVGIYVSPNRLEISDSEGEKDITVTSTIPVVCDQELNCCLTFYVAINKKPVFLRDSCDYKICLSDWDPAAQQAAFNITVVPSRNAIEGGTREAVLSFKELVPTDSSPYSKIFKGFHIAPVQVVVHLEAGFQCSITGDPHFLGFDFKGIYHLYQTGDYTVYEVKYRDFLVQIRTWPCWAVTCICGVVVKEKNDIIRVYGCDKSGSLLASTVDIPYKLSPGTVLMRSGNGQHVGILFPSGSEMKIDIYEMYMDVYIQTPAYDRSKARGICGTNDGIAENDFTHPDGTITPICPNFDKCMPTPFTESWKVVGAASMFELTPNKVGEEPNSQYCSCTSSSVRKTKETCSSRQHIQNNKLLCQGCDDITEHLTPSPWGQPGQVQKPYQHQTVKPVDPNKQWPNDNGVTEAQAKDLCSQAIQKSQLYPRCQNVDNLVSSAMTECLGDILNGGTTDALNAVTSSFTSKCQLTLAKDEKNYNTSSDGDEVLSPQVSDNVCPIECSTHGKCGQSGKCECLSGWEGETCQIETGKGPQITYTTGGPLCYASQKSCDSVQFDKSNVNIHNKLKCRVQQINTEGSKTSQPVIVDSSDQSSTRITCPLPNTELSSQNYTVSVTADGAAYSNELPVYTFDSTCLDCSDSGCKEKNTACHIQKVCYRDGEINKNNEKLVCDVSRDLTDWSNLATLARNRNTIAGRIVGQTTPTGSLDQTTPQHHLETTTPTSGLNRITTTITSVDTTSSWNTSSTALNETTSAIDLSNFTFALNSTLPKTNEGILQYLEYVLQHIQELMKKIKNQ